MTPALEGFARGLVLILLLIAVAVPSQADPYDTPALSLVDAGLFQVTLRVEAGPSGAPNGFHVEWMTRYDFDRLGGWPEIAGPALVFCAYVGAPTLNLWGASSFQLAPRSAAMVQPGDLFDETGIVTNAFNELKPGLEYVFRARAEGDATAEPSAFSAQLSARTSGSAECTQGFWKNHPGLWPPACTPMVLGSVLYSQADLLGIYGQPAAGNGLVSLAHQLITAKLNLCNGSSPAPITATIASADALIGGLVCPPNGSDSLDPSVTSPLTEELDKYNNGKLGGIIECPTAVRARATWGAIKTRYR